MKTRYLAIAALILLAGCEPTARDETALWVLPDGLKDCKVFFLSNTDGGSITVVRCPATATSEATTTTRYPSGKTTKTVTVVETTTTRSEVSPSEVELPVAPEAPEPAK